MACSYCGLEGHNVQTCSSVRRCSQCGGRGHDRRTCRDTSRILENTSSRHSFFPVPLADLRRLCRRQDGLLAHLYWPQRFRYFERNRDRHISGEGWLLVATPGHGVYQPTRPTLNFLRADGEFADHYEEASQARGFVHGVLLKSAAIEEVGRLRGYELVDVTVGHPAALSVDDPDLFWRFDVGKYRYGVLHNLRYAQVVRLATPSHVASRRVFVRREAVVAWW